jgi:putative tricarboxylic transport membrane protein
VSRMHVKRKSEFVVVALLAAFSGLLFWDTITAPADVMQRGPVGPQTMPFAVASLLLLCAAVLTFDLLRGRQGKPEEGEAGERSDWKTCGIIAAAVLLTATVMESIGWVIAGGLMFYLCVYAFGSRHYIRDFFVSAGLAVGSFYLFFSGLGIPLPAGLLQGVL